jgi:hypothetical protein
MALDGVISHQVVPKQVPKQSAELALLHLLLADARINTLRSQLDRLEEEKADITLVTQYTGQVSCFVLRDSACITEMDTSVSALDILPGCSPPCQHDVHSFAPTTLHIVRLGYKNTLIRLQPCEIMVNCMTAWLLIRPIGLLRIANLSDQLWICCVCAPASTASNSITSMAPHYMLPWPVLNSCACVCTLLCCAFWPGGGCV